MYSVPPFGYNYLSPAPPLMVTPFISAATGINNGQRFPFSFPPHNVSVSDPDTSVNWANFAPLSAGPFFGIRNRAPYIADYMFSVQRQFRQRAVLTVSYVGNQGHRIPAMVSLNAGDPALCLRLAGCGPFGEDNTYTTAGGEIVYGTRTGQNDGPRMGSGENYGENTADKSIANSSYNALEATARYQHNGSQILLSYAFAKSIDQGSNIGEQLDPLDPRQSHTVSAWDQKHTFAATYALGLPIERISRKSNRLITDWTISGTTRFATGFPVTLTTIRTTHSWARWAMGSIITSWILRDISLGRLRSTRMAEMENLPLIQSSFRKRTLDSSATQGVAFSTAAV
jgi:hypothetical protein